MATYSELINKKTGIEKIKDFFAGRFYFVIALAILFFLTKHFFSEKYYPYEFWAWVVLSIFYLYVLVKRNKYYRSNPLASSDSPYTKEHRKEIWVIIVMMVLFFFFFASNPQWLWLICITIISLSIIVVVRCYPTKFEPVNEQLEHLRLLEIVTIAIAFCQLFVAYPQMMNSYKSATGDDVKSIRDYLVSLQKSFSNIKEIEVPDSYKGDKAVDIRKTIYFQSKNIFDWDIFEADNKLFLSNPIFSHKKNDLLSYKDEVVAFAEQNSLIAKIQKADVCMLINSLQKAQNYIWISEIQINDDSLLEDIDSFSLFNDSFLQRAEQTLKEYQNTANFFTHVSPYSFGKVYHLLDEGQKKLNAINSNISTHIDDVNDISAYYIKHKSALRGLRIKKECSIILDLIKEYNYTFAELLPPIMNLSVSYIKAYDAYIISGIYDVQYLESFDE